jgi:hypothetical protein
MGGKSQENVDRMEDLDLVNLFTQWSACLLSSKVAYKSWGGTKFNVVLKVISGCRLFS